MGQGTDEDRLERVEAGQQAMHQEMTEGFRRVDASLDNIEGRRDNIEGRLDNIEGRLDNIDGRLDNIEGRLDKHDERLERVEAGQQAMHQEMAEGFERVDGHLDKHDERFDKVEAAIENLRTESIGANVELREYIEFVSHHHAVETRQHFDIVAEDLREDLKKIAEGQVATTEKIDRLEQKMDNGFADLTRDVAGMIAIAMKHGG